MDAWLKTKDLPTYYLAVCGLVCKEDKVLLVRSARRGWEIPGGVVERGEDVRKALIREIQEESGILCKPVSITGFYQNLCQKEGYGPLEGILLPPVACLGFLADYVSGDPTATSELCGDGSPETLEAGWFTREEALSMVHYPSYDFRLKDMLTYRGTPEIASYYLSRGGEISFPDPLLMPLSAATVVCIGDSLTEGDYGIPGVTGVANVHSENYPYFLSCMTGASVINFGKCGWRSSHMLAWFEQTQPDLTKADFILLMLGTNGGQCSQGDSEENRAYLRLIEGIQKAAPRAALVLMTPPHVTENPTYSNCGYAPQVREAVLFVRQTAASLRLPLIDLAASPRLTADTEDELQSNDGLHFNEKGYRVLAEEVLKGVQAIRGC